MVIDEFTTGSFYDSAAVGGGIVRLALAEGNTLGHWGRRRLMTRLTFG